VLAEPPDHNGLREQSRFAVLSTRLARLDITYPASSASTRSRLTGNLYCHPARHAPISSGTSSAPTTCGNGAAAAADRRQAGTDETMRGYPARATSPGGTGAHTLYTKGLGGFATFNPRPERGRALGVLHRPAGLEWRGRRNAKPGSSARRCPC
jgi:hypothetical protein